MSGKRAINRDGYFDDKPVEAAPLPDDFLNTLTPAIMDAVGYSGQSLPVVRHTDGTVQVGSFQMSPTGLIIRAEITRDEWEAFYRGVQRIKRSLQWIVGDWMLYGAERGWIQSYEDMAEITGLKDTTVKNYTYVCRSVPASLRSDKLAFAHFQEIAPLDDNVKQDWIGYAIKEKLSVRQLREAIQAHLGQPIEKRPPLLDKSNRRRFSKLWRLTERGQPEKIKRDDIRQMRDWLDDLEKTLPKK